MQYMGIAREVLSFYVTKMLEITNYLL